MSIAVFLALKVSSFCTNPMKLISVASLFPTNSNHTGGTNNNNIE